MIIQDINQYLQYWPHQINYQRQRVIADQKRTEDVVKKAQWYNIYILEVSFCGCNFLSINEWILGSFGKKRIICLVYYNGFKKTVNLINYLSIYALYYNGSFLVFLFVVINAL